MDIEVLNVTQTRGPESQTREESCQALGLYEADYKEPARCTYADTYALNEIHW